jgi:hypothetical protein
MPSSCSRCTETEKQECHQTVVVVLKQRNRNAIKLWYRVVVVVLNWVTGMSSSCSLCTKTGKQVCHQVAFVVLKQGCYKVVVIVLKQGNIDASVVVVVIKQGNRDAISCSRCTEKGMPSIVFVVLKQENRDAIKLQSLY